MRRTMLVCAMSLAAAGLLASAYAMADGSRGKGHGHIKVQLRGAEEAPLVITDGSGTLELDIDDAAQSIAYELRYEDLEGAVTQAHIHIGQRDVSGGIAMWLCQVGNNAPASVQAITPACPAPGDTVSGTLTSANVIGPAAQGVPAGAFADVLRAIRAGKAYANVHTQVSPSGEIRGQIH